LPEAAIKSLSSAEYAATTAAKRRDKNAGSSSQRSQKASWQKRGSIALRLKLMKLHQSCLFRKNDLWSLWWVPSRCQTGAVHYVALCNRT
jgi:hypothetical protein